MLSFWAALSVRCRQLLLRTNVCSAKCIAMNAFQMARIAIQTQLTCRGRHCIPAVLQVRLPSPVLKWAPMMPMPLKIRFAATIACTPKTYAIRERIVARIRFSICSHFASFQTFFLKRWDTTDANIIFDS